jgi:hypothetical protein
LSSIIPFAGSGVAGFFMGMFLRRVLKFLVIIIGSFLGAEKSLDDFRLRQIAKEIKLKPSQYMKFNFIEQQASKGNVLARQYLEKLRTEEVNIDWAHRVLIKVIPKKLEHFLPLYWLVTGRYLRSYG